jgi:hypothetical protein
VEHEAEAAPESSISYDEAKDICLAYLVLVNRLSGVAWVPDYVGRSDIYVVNKMGGLLRKNRRHGADFYFGNGSVNPSGTASCTTTILNFNSTDMNFAES